MKKLLWIVTWIAAAVWSLVAWGLWNLFGFVGGTIADGAQGAGQTSYILDGFGWIVRGVFGLGAAVVGFIWLLGIVFILGVAWLMGRLMVGGQPIVVLKREDFRYGWDRREDDGQTVTLDPDEWRETSTGEAPRESAMPRIAKGETRG